MSLPQPSLVSIENRDLKFLAFTLFLVSAWVLISEEVTPPKRQKDRSGGDKAFQGDGT
jgi:hypothetical protein